MAIANIIAKGVGFLPNTVSWLVTHGFGLSFASPVPIVPLWQNQATGPLTPRFQGSGPLRPRHR